MKLTNAKLTLVDGSDNARGKLTSQNGSGVYVDVNSEFTLGIEDRPVVQFPEIIGKTNGVEKQIIGEGDNQQQGTFNFFDGKITGKTAIYGTTDLTPIIYNATATVNGDGDQVSTLAIITGKEARIGRKTYTLLEEAIAAASTEGEQVEIVLLKDISKAQKVEIASNKNIKLDLDGYTLTTTAEDYVLENDGKLEIVDSSATEENPYGNGKITSTTYHTILNKYEIGDLIDEIPLDGIVTNSTYGFDLTNDGKLINNNQYVHGTTAHAYLELDLTDESYEEKLYMLTVNAEVSSENGYDFGYVYITETTDNQDYGNEGNRFMIISGILGQADYLGKVFGGKKYYLHFGYRKDGSANNGSDRFTINSVKLNERYNAQLKITSGNILCEKTGESGSIKKAIVNDGILNVGDKNNNLTAPNIRGVNSYTAGIENNSIAVIESGKLSGSSAAIRSYGITTIENGEFNSPVCSNSNTMTIKDGTFNENVGFNNAGKINIEGGTFNSGYILGYDNDGSGKGSLNITGGTINREVRGKSGDSIVINGGTIASVLNEGNGTIEIQSGTINGNIKNSSTGRIDIKGGSLKNALNTNSGTINISGGTFNTTGNVVQNTSSGIVNITGGTFTTTGVAINNSNSGTINIEKGNITTTNGTAISNSTKGTIILGVNDDEVDNESLVIDSINGVGICNISGTFKYYDGTVKGKVDNSVDGVTEIPEGKDIVISFEGENNSVEVATIGIPTAYVAQIGANKYTTLQNAINAVSTDGQETEITIIAPIYLSRTCIVPEGKNVLIDTNGYNTKCLMRTTIFENNGKLTIKDNANTETIVSRIYEKSPGRLFTNNGELNIHNLEMTIYNVDGDYYTYYNFIVNNGDIEINGTYLYTTNHYICLIYNNNENAKITMNSGTLQIHSEWDSFVINNASNGEVIIKGGTVSASKSAIYNNASGSVTINGGTVYGNKAIYNRSGTITVNDGTVEASYGNTALHSDNGLVEINGGIIDSHGYYAGAGVYCGNGTLIITGGTFSSSDNAISVGGSTNVEMKNASVSCTRNGIRFTTSGTVLMEDLLITACVNNPLYIKNATATLNNVEINRSSSNGAAMQVDSSTTVTCTDVKISGYQTGIDNSGNLTVISSDIKNNATGINNKGTLTLGVDDNQVRTNEPSISGTTTGISNSGTFNYYDGVLKGKQNQSYTGTIALQPETYEPIRTYNSETGIETTILDRAYVVINTVTEERYVSLQEAVNACEDNTEETLQLLREYNLASNASSITIPAEKIINLDLNGYKINATNKDTLINNGDLRILNSNTDSTGRMVNSNYGLIKNLGTATLTITGVSLTTSASSYTEESETKTVYTIDNSSSGNITLDGVTISAPYAINHNNTGTVEILNGSELTGGTINIQNRTSGNIIVTDSEIIGSTNIINYSTGDITINGNSKLTGYTNSIENNSTGNIIINGGYIEADRLGVNLTNGHVTVNSGTVYGKVGIKAGSGTEIDINGGTIRGHYVYGYGTGSQYDNGHAIKVSGTTIRITDGTVYGESYGMILNDSNTVYISGGTHKGTMLISSSSQVNISDGTFGLSTYYRIDNSGELNISGGTFTTDNTSEYLLSNSKTTNISGGEFIAIRTALSNSGTMNISKAIITTTTSNGLPISNSGTLTLAVDHDNIVTDSIVINSESTGIYSSNSLTLGIKDQYVDNDSIQITASGTAINVSGSVNSKFYYYEGTLIGANPIEGVVDEITDNYRITKEIVDDKYKDTLKPLDVIAMIDTNEFTTLQAAIDTVGSEQTTIKIVDSFILTKEDETTIPSGKDIIIDLDGNTIETHGGTLLTNNGTLKIEDNGVADKGVITGYCNYLISNTGDIELNVDISTKQAKRVLSNTGTGNVKLSGGSIIERGNSYGSNYVIYSNTTSPIVIENTSISTQSLTESCSAIYGLGDITVTGGSISMSGYTGESGKYSIILNIGGNQESFVPTITISGVDWSGTGTYGIYSNTNANVDILSGNIGVDRSAIWLNSSSQGQTTISGGTLSSSGANSTNTLLNSGSSFIKVNGGTISYTGSAQSAIRAEAGTLEVNDGTINGGSGTGIYTRGITDIKGGIISGNSCGVNVNTGTTNITAGTITGSTYGVYTNAGTTDITGGSITGTTYGVYVNNGTTNITGITVNSSIYGVYVNSGIFNLNNAEVVVSGENDNAYGIYIKNGTVTLGEKAYPVSKISPEITSYKYGVYHEGGTFNFYDGIINGEAKAIYGTVEDTPELFTVDISDDEKCAILGVIITFNDVAYYDSVYYDSLQAAISVAGTNVATIEINKDIVLNSTLNIAAGQNITLDMNGHSIIIMDEDYTIINNGTLTIKDTLLTDVTSTDASVIENKVTSGVNGATQSAAIYNAVGATLTLGVDDATVHPCVPTVIGDKYAIENYGTLNIFDGTLKAFTSTIGGTQTTFSVPTGYTYEEITDTNNNNIKIFRLKLNQ